MPSIIEGYNYDIFISYRQKDNKGDRWVSKFVDALKTELEATFKEDVSVYFDENPHDRLQETYNVNKSLEGKLKCLVFIPILSQTYCDPNSYAWQNEFLAYLRMAESDRFGKDVKLKSGNVSSRILPVRIHDLEPDDIKLFEKETGSVLRCMDFIFKTSTGVNRPLKVNEDHPNDNINKTFYSDQINKVARAIKEIIQGMKAETVPSDTETSIKPESEGIIHKGKIEEGSEGYSTSRMHKVRSGLLIIIALIIIVIAAFFPRIIHPRKYEVTKDPDGRISIAVTNFDNNTNDTTLNWLKTGIPELLRNNIAGAKEFYVQNTQTMNELYENFEQTKNASIIPSLSREVAIKLKAGNYITGTFQKYGNQILTLVKLIDTKSDEVIWTGKSEGTIERITTLADSLSAQIKNFLEIKVLKQKVTTEYGDINTTSPEALRKYIEGMQLLIEGKMKQARQSFEESYKLDTTFTLAAFYTAYSNDYDIPRDFIFTQKWIRITYRNKKRLPYDYQIWAESWNAGCITRNCDSTLYFNNLLAQSDIKSRLFWCDIGTTLNWLNQTNAAVKAFENVETINSEWGGDLKFLAYYIQCGWAYHKAGLHEKEAKIFEKGLSLFPDNEYLLWCQARCAISQKDEKLAADLINKMIEWYKAHDYSESFIETELGNLYAEEKSFDKADEHYRAAYKLAPHDKAVITSLAYFLIINDRNIQEGMGLVNLILASYPDDYDLMKAKGIGLYKQGRYNESYEILKEFQGYKKDAMADPEAFGFLKKVKETLGYHN
jgi:TolB-like protein